MKAPSNGATPAQFVKVTTPVYEVSTEAFTPRLGTYEYTVSWQGMPAASCILTITRRQEAYVVDLSARTYRTIDPLYRLRYSAKGIISQRNLWPTQMTSEQENNSQSQSIEINFSPELETISVLRRRTACDTHPTQASFLANNFTLDPIGAAFIARALPWQVGTEHSFDVLNGANRYHVILAALRRETLVHRGRETPAFVIKPTIRNLTEIRPDSILREASIYLSDNRDREVLKIVSSLSIGEVTTLLDSFVPLSSRNTDSSQTLLNHDFAACS